MRLWLILCSITRRIRVASKLSPKWLSPLFSRPKYVACIIGHRHRLIECTVGQRAVVTCQLRYAFMAVRRLFILFASQWINNCALVRKLVVHRGERAVHHELRYVNISNSRNRVTRTLPRIFWLHAIHENKREEKQVWYMYEYITIFERTSKSKREWNEREIYLKIQGMTICSNIIIYERNLCFHQYNVNTYFIFII